jgi:methylamine--corrinoid protein Co-methyltransferase
MNSRARILDIIDRSLNGPIVSEYDFDMDRVYRGITRVVKEYDIRVAEDRFITTDHDLCDRAWNAAIDFLASCGVYSKDTGRVIEFSESEIRELMNMAPAEVTVGGGRDEVTLYARDLDDERPCSNMGAPVGIPVDDEYFEAIVTSYFQEPRVDMYNAPTLESYRGRPIRTRSPLEILGAHDEWARLKSIAKKCGRPGISLVGTVISVSDVGHLSAGKWMDKGDTLAVGMISELKVDNTIMNKVTDAVLDDKIIFGYADPIYGGLGGGVPGQIVLTIAAMIALHIVMMCEVPGYTPTHPLLFVTDTKELLNVTNIAYTGIRRNSNLICRLTSNMAGGCGTKTLLYETIATAMIASKSGFGFVQGPRPATGVIKNVMSGLEARFQGEITAAAVKIDRDKADEIIRRAFDKFKDDLDKQPFGKPFQEVYDVNTIKPLDFWQKMYEEVKEEAISWGLPLDQI